MAASYINECASCEQLAIMKPVDGVPWSVWGFYCIDCIDGDKIGNE